MTLLKYKTIPFTIRLFKKKLSLAITFTKHQNLITTYIDTDFK